MDWLPARVIGRYVDLGGDTGWIDDRQASCRIPLIRDQEHARVRAPTEATWLVIVARDSEEFTLPVAMTSPLNSELLDYTIATITRSGHVTTEHHAGRGDRLGLSQLAPRSR